MAAPKAEKESDAPPGAPAWIVSFADMSLLLLSFFIMLMAVSTQELAADEDLLKILASIKVGFGYMPPENSNERIDLAVLQILARKKGGPEMSNMRNKSPAIKGERVSPRDQQVAEKGTVGRITFSKNSAAISTEMRSNLDRIAVLVSKHPRTVVIEGHCSADEAGRDAEEGYELAFQRARAVRDGLIERGIPSERLRMVSSGAFDPVRNAPMFVQQRAEVKLGTYFLSGTGANSN